MYADELFRKLKPIYGKQIDRLWLKYVTSDYKQKQEIEGLLELFHAKSFDNTFNQDKILLVPPEKDLAYGPYYFGHVVYNNKRLYPFGLREQDWIQHIGIFGRSGAGKTNLVFLIINNLLIHKKPFLIFDWKRNYRDVLELKGAENVRVYTVGRDVSPFRFNPLIPPPGVDHKTWFKKVIEIIGHAYFTGEGVMYLLSKTMEELFSRPENAETLRFTQVFKRLEQEKAVGRRRQWLDSSIRVVRSLCYGEFGKTINSKQNFDIEALLKQNIILELDALPNSDKTFIIEILLLYIHQYKINKGRREQFDHAIIIEEAHHVLLRKKQETIGGEAITDTILREIRELGESIILIDQHPSLISIPALGNTNLTLTFNLKHHWDLYTISNSTLLNKEETKYLGQLPIGYAIVKLQSRIPHSFLIYVPKINIEKGKTSEHVIEQRISGLSGLSDLENADLKDSNDFHSFQTKEKEEISEVEIELLLDIARRPTASVTDRFQKLGLSGRKGIRARENLVQRGLIQKVILNTGKTRKLLLELNEKARPLLKDFKFTINSVEHEYWREVVAKHYKNKGYDVQFEERINGAVDLVARKYDELIAIEIETGKSDFIVNIEKAILHGFSTIICVPTNKRAETKIKNKLKQTSYEANVKILPAKNFS